MRHHSGKIVYQHDEVSIIDCEQCGFAHANPIPTEEQLEEYYKKKYYDHVKKSGQAPEIRRFMEGGEAAKTERQWLCNTLYTDIHDTLVYHGLTPISTICDVGCGTGDFLKYMQENAWNCVGIEPSEKAASYSEDFNLTIYQKTLESFISSYPQYSHGFDAITLLNVLEHVASPRTVIEQIKALLKPTSGILVIRVPNDFTAFQQYAQAKLAKEPWWVGIPDHLNYFSIVSLQRLLVSAGFEILHTITDFPMEFFLLMGDDYNENPEVGEACHKRRVSFELSLPKDARRELYHCLGERGIGRTCMVFARIKPE